MIVLETTGASESTPRLLDGLRQRHEVRLVRVRAGAETCARRIEERDPSRQIQVSPELVRAMHERSEALCLAFDLEVVNDPPLAADEVARAFAAFLS